jgi:hypothetical protein
MQRHDVAAATKKCIATATPLKNFLLPFLHLVRLLSLRLFTSLRTARHLVVQRYTSRTCNVMLRVCQDFLDFSMPLNHSDSSHHNPGVDAIRPHIRPKLVVTAFCQNESPHLQQPSLNHGASSTVARKQAVTLLLTQSPTKLRSSNIPCSQKGLDS